MNRLSSVSNQSGALQLSLMYWRTKSSVVLSVALLGTQMR